jgi:hypothetical protein
LQTGDKGGGILMAEGVCVTARAAASPGGYFVRFPLGGYVWQTLDHLIGFSRLGCDVFTMTPPTTHTR